MALEGVSPRIDSYAVKETEKNSLVAVARDDAHRDELGGSAGVPPESLKTASDWQLLKRRIAWDAELSRLVISCDKDGSI